MNSGPALRQPPRGGPRKLKLKIQTSIHLRRLDTLFVGRVFHDLPSVDSTNSHALSILSKSKPPEGTVVFTLCQTAGRGQLGNVWESEPGKNISLSVILYPSFLLAQNQFLLNQAISLAVADTVAGQFPETQVKWPNDIYVGHQKVAGILIQNSISGSYLKSSVVGIGLNVNQVGFSKNAPKAASFRSLAGKAFDIDELAVVLCQNIESRYLNLKTGKIVPLQSEYLERLYRLGKNTIFLGLDGKKFRGIITGVSPFGKLQVEVDGISKAFDLKEISIFSVEDEP